jgi:error-prone DNA polymerase
MPDIDVDFEHERREEIIQHIYGNTAASAPDLPRPSAIGRAAIRESARLGLTEDDAARQHARCWGSNIPQAYIRQTGLTPKPPHPPRHSFRPRLLISASSLAACRRVCSCARAADELTPIANAAMPERTFIEWDKDDIDALGR